MKKAMLTLGDSLGFILGIILAIVITLALCVYILVVSILAEIMKLVSPDVATRFGSLLMAAKIRIDKWIEEED